MNNVSRLQWRKSSYTTVEGAQCVEVADLPAAVAVRDSKDPEGPALVFGRRAFSALVRAL